MQQLKKLIMTAVAILTVCLCSTASKADTVGICDPDGVLQCTAEVSLIGNVLTIKLTNTSPGANPAFITAAAFNLTGTVTGFTTITNANFALFGPAPTGWTGSVSPDGTRTHLISATGNDYNGGGSPNGGIPGNGGTATFTVTFLTGHGNNEASIFASLLIRGRGEAGSDKDPLTPSTPIPEPASMFLLGAGLVGAAARIRQRRRSVQE